MGVPVRKYEEGTAAMGDDGKGVGKDGRKGAGTGDYVKVSGSNSAYFW